MTTYNVIVAGAGPAGIAVAVRLAQFGKADGALVLDRYHFPRDKPCGGGLTGHADQVMAELELTLDVPNIPARNAVVQFGEFERSIELGSAVNVVRRTEFDHSLVAQARRRNIEVVEGEGVVDYHIENDCVLVKTSGGRTLRTKVLVGADGAPSVVRKQLCDGQKDTPHRLFRLEFSAPSSAAVERWGQSMLYDFTLMQRGLRGYLWIFPLPDNSLNVGLMHYPATDSPKSGRELTELLRTRLDELGIALPSRGTRGWPVWGYHPKHPISCPRVLTVGDAAGIDGLTGEGIAVAMEHAVIAGDRIARGLESGDLSFSDYPEAMRRAVVGRELNLDRRLAKMLYASRGTRWQEWLSLILFDPDMLKFYAARVDGSEILADQPGRLARAFARHLWHRRGRRAKLRALMES